MSACVETSHTEHKPVWGTNLWGSAPAVFWPYWLAHCPRSVATQSRLCYARLLKRDAVHIVLADPQVILYGIQCINQ